MWIFQKSPFLDFNPRSREGSDHRAYCFVDRFVYFNPRSREGSDSHPLPVSHAFALHFNPRSREGSDIPLEAIEDIIDTISTHAPARGATTAPERQKEGQTISTHAPARGATHFNDRYYNDFTISTHAPARGATIQQAEIVSVFRNFNPRSREGSDLW